ncbi:MAG: serine hydrolase, partial [bacterium]|nr:serine hydrolase [bacterium]
MYGIHTARQVVPLALLAAARCCWADPVPTDVAATLQQAEQAVATGRYAEAEQMLRAKRTDPDGPVVEPCAVALEVIRRTRMDYSLTPEAMLAKLRRGIPDVTADDMDRWREQGLLQHRHIDGQVRYFKREPSNLLRFSEEARSRRTLGPQRSGWRFSWPPHLAKLLAQAKASETPLVHPVKHRISYRLKVNDGHPRLHPGAKVRCWLPFPQEYRQQQDVRLIATKPAGAVVAPNGHPQRTLYFEQTLDDAATAPEFSAEFEFVTYAYCPPLEPAKAQPDTGPGPPLGPYLVERPPHIVFTPEVRAIAQNVAAKEINPLLRARKIFRWVCENISYCSEMEYSTIENLSAKALAAHAGDCGVQAMTFITLCRAADIPARWQSGWETKPNGWNMHDWAEFYVAPWGWLPADPSYGLQDHADPEVQEFFCGRMDAYRMIVNLDYARELHPAKTSFRSEPNDFQRGEIEIDGHNLYFDEWDWTFDVQTVPLTGGVASLEEALDAVVPDAMVAGRIPGAVIAVGRKTSGGFETWQKAYGFQRTQPEHRPMPDNAVFDMASLTKPIATGTSLMILADRGRLSLDDPVGKYLPEFADGPKAKMTIRQVMTHRSGLPAYLSMAARDGLKKQAGFPCAAETREYIRSADLTGAPGETVIYSCLNAIIAAEIVEAISDTSLDRFAADNIFGPLGMNETGFNPSESLRLRLVPTTAAKRGRGRGGFLEGQVHDPLAAMQSGVSGNAGLFSTAADLGRFAQMILNGGELNGRRILAKDTVEKMTSIQNPGAKIRDGNPDGRGLLWDLYPPDPGDRGVDALYAFGHNGYTGTALRIFPEQGVYILALTNRVHPDDSGKVTALRQAVWTAVGRV